MYIIKRLDQGGGYVAPSGRKNSYTNKLEIARKFDTLEDAEAELCPDNEIALNIYDILNG